MLDLLAVCGGVAEHVLLSDVTDDLVAGIIELRATGLVAEDIRRRPVLPWCTRCLPRWPTTCCRSS